MKDEKFNEILMNASIPRYKWLWLPEIESIVLNSGIGIYPDWLHMKFYIGKNEIYIKHGHSRPYGARLSTTYRLNATFMQLGFMPSNIIIPTKYYNEFRLPKVGDIIISSDGIGNILSESMITSVDMCSNLFTIKVIRPIKDTPTSKLSFYDPNEYNREICVHSEESEGIYMKFIENEGKYKKDIGVYHDVIKIKNIKEINLRLAVAGKTYKIY